MNNIYLIGMPGCGKSTLGKAISEKLNMTFTDTDEMIVQKAGMPISEIFGKYGEEHFRDIETECIKEISKEENFVIATGGGLPLRQENRDVMNATGIVIFIDVDLEMLIKRSAFGGRPLLEGDGVKKLTALYNARYEIYKNTASVIYKSGEDLSENIENVLKIIDKQN